jgi:hypothetical protein
MFRSAGTSGKPVGFFFHDPDDLFIGMAMDDVGELGP